MNKNLLIILIFIKLANCSFSQSLGKKNLLTSSITYKTQEEFSIKEFDSLVTSNKVIGAKSKVSYPTSDDFLWIKFEINWGESDKEKIIELNNPFINKVVLYQVKDNNYYKIGYGGDKSFNFYQRTYINRRFIFPLQNTLEKTSYYLMIDNRMALMLIPIWIWGKQQFELNEIRENIFYIIYFSFIFFIGVISIIINLITKNRLFLHYALYIWSLWIYIFTLLGFSFQYIYPENSNITSDTRYFTVSILIITSINFVISFLKMKDYSKHIFKIIRVIQYIFVLLVFLYFINRNIFYKHSIALTYFFRIIYFVIINCTLIGLYRIWKTEIKRALLFIVSVFFVILGFITFIAIQLDIIPHYWFSINPVIVGVGLEILVLSIAMFYILKKILLTNTSLHSEKDHLKNEIKELNKILKNKEENISAKILHLKSKAIINISEILYIKSDGHYIEYFLNNKTTPEVDRSSLTEVLQLLPNKCFIRIHKSYIVNINFIKIINSTKVMLENGVWINLSRTYKQQLKDVLDK